MKAVVMEIKGPDAAVLCEDGTFRKIPDAAYEVGMTVEIADNVLHPKFNKALITAAAAAVILVTAAGGSIAYANYAPYRTVTVGDTDYTVNRYNKVLSAYQSGQKVEVVRFQDIEKIVSENEAASAVAASETDAPSAALPENIPVSSEASENKPVTPVKPQTRISDNQTAAEQPQHESAQEDTQQSQTQQEEQPQETQQSAQKEQPQKTQQPAQKEQPQDTQQPTQKEQPQDTQQPAQKEQPQDTQQPAQKEQPQDTQQPAQKEQPQDTQQPTQKEQSQPDHEVQRQEQQVQEQQVQEPDQKTGPADQNMNR